MLDANADSTDPSFNAFIADTVLYNVVSHHSPEVSNQSTYINSKKRLDYVLVSGNILISGTGAGHSPYSLSRITEECTGTYLPLLYLNLFSKAPLEYHNNGYN